MQRSILVIAGLLLIAAAALGWWVERPHEPFVAVDATPTTDETAPTTEPSPEKADPLPAMAKGDPPDALVPAIKLNPAVTGIPGATTIRPMAGEMKLLSPSESLLQRISLESDFTADLRAHFHAHGEDVCASGCAASRHPTRQLTKSTFHQLLKEYAAGPMDETNLALETLLYFGRQTKVMLADEGPYPLDQPRIDFLNQQLAYDHAKIQIRLVDEYGETRTWLPSTRVPFDRRHVFTMDVNRLQPLVTSGTVKRVGLYHLWTRL